MNDFDNFCSEILEQAKRFYEKAKTETDSDGIKAFQNSCLMLSVCALEAYINGISDEICVAKDFPMQAKSVLLEKEIRLENGEFNLSNSLKMSRLTDKIELLYFRHTQQKISEQLWWNKLKTGIDIRNKLTHPKDNVTLSNEFLEATLNAIIECLSSLYKAVYKRPFPKQNLQLTSRYVF